MSSLVEHADKGSTGSGQGIVLTPSAYTVMTFAPEIA